MVKDPKNRPLLYVVTGVIAVAAAVYFLMLPSAGILDWFILAMGIVSIFKGVQEYLQLHGGLAGIRRKSGGSGPDLGTPDDKA